MEAVEITQLAVIEKSIDVFRSAPEVLQANQIRTQKAVSVGESIIGQWQAAWDVDSEEERLAALAVVDERSNKYLVNCGNALKEEKQERAAITQMMDMFKRMFTEAENELDRTKANTITNKVQSNRDMYVAEVAKIQERNRREAERIAAEKKEVIELKQIAEMRFTTFYNDRLLGEKNKLQGNFNRITLENYESATNWFAKYVPELNGTEIEALDTKLTSARLGSSVLADIRAQALHTLMAGFTANYRAALSLLQQELIDRLPSKKAELIEQKRLADEAAEAKRKADEAAAQAKDEAEKDRLRAIADKAEADSKEAARKQKEREAEEAARIVQEAADAKQKADQDAAIKAQGEKTMVMFEQEAAVAEAVQAPEARLGYEITVLHPVGYTQIFALWFEAEGKDMPVDKIGNTKLEQMKAWAEKHAHKTGTKIDSRFLKYEESYKAVNRKSK